MTLCKLVRKSIQKMLGEFLFHASGKKLQMCGDKDLHTGPFEAIVICDAGE